MSSTLCIKLCKWLLWLTAVAFHVLQWAAKKFPLLARERRCAPETQWGQGGCTTVPHLVVPSAGSINYSQSELVWGSGKDTIAGPVLSPRPHHTTSWHLSFALCSLTFGYFLDLWVFSFFLSSLFVSSADLLLLVYIQDWVAFSIPSASSLCLASLPCGLDSVALVSEVATCHTTNCWDSRMARMALEHSCRPTGDHPLLTFLNCLSQSFSTWAVMLPRAISSLRHPSISSLPRPSRYPSQPTSFILPHLSVPHSFFLRAHLIFSATVAPAAWLPTSQLARAELLYRKSWK